MALASESELGPRVTTGKCRIEFSCGGKAATEIMQPAEDDDGRNGVRSPGTRTIWLMQRQPSCFVFYELCGVCAKFAAISFCLCPVPYPAREYFKWAYKPARVLPLTHFRKTNMKGLRGKYLGFLAYYLDNCLLLWLNDIF